jgi:hypothetical protein
MKYVKVLKFYDNFVIQYTMGRGVDIPWVGGNKISKFPKNQNFQKSSKSKFFL